jgi:hypothetical protein
MSDLGPQIVVAVTGIAGAGLGLAGGIAVERIRSTDARTARDAARQQQLDDFQRETLIAFQEVIGRYARANGRAWHHDEMEFKRTGKWMSTLLGEDINRELFEASRDARQLVQRVRDDEVRAKFTAYHGAQSEDAAAAAPLPGQSDTQRHETARDRHMRIAQLQQALEDRLGEVLRALL